jgi:phosphomannomutase
MAVSPGIYRQYDIRGIVGRDLTAEAATAVGRGYAALMRQRGVKGRIVVSRDNRPSGEMLRDALVAGLTAFGVDVVDIGVVPTPINYWALHHLGVAGGIQITGSHNPPEYNGFKLSMGTGSLHGEEIQKLYQLIATDPGNVAKGKVTTDSVIDRYIDDIVERTGPLPKGMKVVYDCGNGAASLVAPQLFARLGIDAHGLFCESDGTFPNHHPDPTEPENLHHLQELVAKEKLDIGIAFDGDGDRIGAIDAKGRIIWGDQLLAILGRDVLAKHPGATIIADVKASQALFDEIAKMGGKPLMWKTGHSLIKVKMAETKSPPAGEMSGHIFFADEYYGFDDALYGAVRLLRAVARSGKSLTELRDALPTLVNTPEIRIPCPDDRKFAIVSDLAGELRQEGADFNDVDGIRISKEGGWWLLRASNTQAVLVARAEAPDEKVLAGLKSDLKARLAKHGVAFAG